ncbi:helix-turn-helix domain-containing protein [Streptococcus sp. S784/96/1]|uniref:helix-turn-helix domain-containing protein n=1 Tax=Streptococcus sp. S784/96/1 TaxID=2653499 RepID=UPI0013872351|nr:helix-turn-helix transcriptional regulator [Streptococcus sp. S784/96/1]
MNRVKELRKNKKLTQKELVVELSKIVIDKDTGKKFNISLRTLQNWESGESQIKPDKAQALADFFGVSVGYLLGFEKFFEIETNAIANSLKFNELLMQNPNFMQAISAYDEQMLNQGKFALSLVTREAKDIALIENSIKDLILDQFYSEQEGEYDQAGGYTLQEELENTYQGIGKLPQILSDFLGQFLTLSNDDKTMIINLIGSLYEKDKGQGLRGQYEKGQSPND